MEHFEVTGMTCAACSSRVEKAVRKLDGIEQCNVSLLTNSMTVEGSAKTSEIIKAVKKAGYGAKALDKKTKNKEEQDNYINSEKKTLIQRLIISITLLLPLMYLSMGHMMWNWPLSPRLSHNHIAIAFLQSLLSLSILIVNKKFFISGTKAIFHLSPNMDSLVALGSGISFLYSMINLFLMTDAQIYNPEKINYYMENLYFESAGTIVSLITLGKLLENISKGKTNTALKALIKLKPATVNVIKNGTEEKVKIEDINIGDIISLRPGESVAVDGIVIEGNTSVDESALTGESIPCDKKEKDSILAGSINLQGYVKYKTTKTEQESSLSKIIQLVSDASSSKAPIAKTADIVSGFFVPAVLVIAIISFIVWLINGAEINFALTKAISVLVISCPCALGLATPVAIMVGNGIGAKNGILFKTSTALEETGKIKIIAFDKTGTITQGKPKVTDILSLSSYSQDEILKMAASLEAKSEHPLGKAILNEVKNRNLSLEEVKDFKTLTGNGLEATLNGEKLVGGSISYISTFIDFSNQDLNTFEQYSKDGKTPLIFIKDSKILGLIAVSDTIKEDSIEAIEELKKLGLTTVMLTGDNEKTANYIAKQAGINKVYAGLLPDEKLLKIQELKKQGKVCMVGDGINDAPALTAANIGIAIGEGTDIAIEASSIVLMKSKLSDLAKAIYLSRKTLLNIKENLFWAFFYNVIGIPLAAGVYYKSLGLSLNPMFGAAAMSLSSFCVISNALRLNFIKLNKKHKEEIMFGKSQTFERTIKVEGMMCEHCEAHVKKALEAVKNIKSAVADHNKGEVIITCSKEISNATIEKAISEAGYKFIS